MNEDTKSPAMQNFLDSMSMNIFGRSRTLAKAGSSCVSCGKPAIKFKDKLSEREFYISSLCQECQNKIFG